MDDGSCVSLTLSFAREWDTIKLLEIPDDLLEAVEKDDIYIKGAPNQEAVLCTSNRTFAIKYLESSNSMFPLPIGTDAVIPASVSGHVSSASLLSVIYISLSLSTHYNNSTKYKTSCPKLLIWGGCLKIPPWLTLKRIAHLAHLGLQSMTKLRQARLKFNRPCSSCML